MQRIYMIQVFDIKIQGWRIDSLKLEEDTANRRFHELQKTGKHAKVVPFIAED